MNARRHRVEFNVSAIDFPPVDGIVENYVAYQSEPFLNNNILLLKITKYFILNNVDNKKEHQVISAKSVYEIPVNEIKSREYVYGFYTDALLGLDEAYKETQTRLPLPNIRLFPQAPIQDYKLEIDRVLNLLNRLN